MGKKEKKIENEKKRGKEGFEKFYSEIFGERWEKLKESLFKDNVYATWQNEGKEPYYLDPASVMAASQLPLNGAETILDMCAAPGGKTLVIASRMNESAVLVSNEKSAARKLRLSSVCDSCLQESIRERVKVSCSDGATWCRTQSECYDRILLDAPCSSERHVLQDEKYLNEWSPARIKTLSMEQWALLSSAWRLLVPGGFLVYSTCALCPQENDEIISRLLKKFDNVKICLKNDSEKPCFPPEIEKYCKLPSIPLAEETANGFHILPDVSEGMGPIWFTLLQKKAD